MLSLLVLFKPLALSKPRLWFAAGASSAALQCWRCPQVNCDKNSVDPRRKN